MIFGVPPPNQDPEFEAKYGGTPTPKQRTEAVAFGIFLITIGLAVVVIVTRAL
jgi:hypothetical protein